MTHSSSINLFLLPASNRNNKYISLLSASLSDADSRVKVIALKGDDLINIIHYLRAGKNSGTKNIIHIQWSTLLYGSRFLLKSLFLLTTNIFLIIFVKFFFRFKIVWTVHNFCAHDYSHPVVDAVGRRILLALADCVIVQQQVTLSKYQIRYPTKNFQYVPHGNYIGAYGAPVERDYALRRSLGFKDDDIVLLSLGAIAPYKLNEKIIQAVVTIQKENSRIKLLVAGKGNERYIEKLINQVPAGAGVVIKNGFIADSDMARLISIADYSIFYYDQSEMTSGGMVLALSYGVPVITRNIPAAELVTGKNGYTFENEDELVAILRKIKSKFVQDDRRGIINDMRVFDWPDSAKKLISIYDNL